MIQPNSNGYVFLVFTLQRLNPVLKVSVNTEKPIFKIKNRNLSFRFQALVFQD